MKFSSVVRGASLWYPIMLAQERGELSHARAAELLGMNIIEYQEKKDAAVEAVMTFVHSLPHPTSTLLSAIIDYERSQNG